MKWLTFVLGNGGARFARVWSIASVSSLLATAVWSQSLTWLGVQPNHAQSEAGGVSADGKVAVGTSRDAAGQPRAFRWQNGRMQDLGTLQGYDRFVAYAVSADGSAVVGTAATADGSRWRAFLWTAPWGMQDLGTLGGVVSSARDISPDGTIVVGAAQGPFGVRAFRWTAAEGMRDLGTLLGYNSAAAGVSADGSVVVGYAYLRESVRALRWTADGRMVDLGTLPGYAYAVAHRTSADGSVVVGYCFNSDNQGRQYQYRAFRWTADGRMVDLGTLGGNESLAYGVSADGSVVVGAAHNSAGQWRACRWTERGIEDLNTTYAELLAPGSYLERAFGLSPDGRYIVGRGFNAATGRTEAYLLDTRCVVPADVNDDGAVNDADLLQVLFNFGTGCNN